jgi:hypothetical protein
MRIRILSAGLAGLCAIVAAPAMVQADSYSSYAWCTTGAGHEFGARNCGFTSFEQCMQTARGNGQMCEQNPWYVAPAAAAQRHRKAQRGVSRNN